MNSMTNSHILNHRFDYHEPASLEEAVGLLSRHNGRAAVLAGGTDLLVHMKMERIAPQTVVSINRIPGLDRIVAAEDGLHIGARATIAAIAGAAPVRAYYAALAEACDAFSTAQVQAMGTLGGNLGNGSPASDSAPALIVAGATVELLGPGGPRRLPLEEFFLGPGKTALEAGELITEIALPWPREGSGSAFLKIARVTADIAKANAAVWLAREGDRIVDCRMAFGSVAPTPVRTPRAEGTLVGQPWSEELAGRAAQIASEEIAPIDDVRSTACYRREAVRALALDGLSRAWQRAAHPKSHPHPSGPIAGAAPESPQASPGLSLGAWEKRPVELRVNGRLQQVWVSPNDLLLNVLRDELQLTGTKYGCGIGECSACTVLMDGRPVLACLVLAVSAAGHDVQTVEGLATPDGQLDPLQEAFLDFAAVQCGYCTPGMLMTAKSLLAEVPRPREEDIRYYLRGNLCRCTGYASIVRAVMAAAERQ